MTDRPTDATLPESRLVAARDACDLILDDYIDGDPDGRERARAGFWHRFDGRLAEDGLAIGPAADLALLVGVREKFGFLFEDSRYGCRYCGGLSTHTDRCNEARDLIARLPGA